MLRAVGEPVVEGVLDGVFDDAAGFDGGELVFRLALEFRFANEDGEHGGGRAHHVVGGDLLGLLVADALAEFAQGLGQRRAEAVLVRAAFAGGDGVAVRAGESVLVGNPGDGPFDGAVFAFLLDVAGEDFLGDVGAAGDFGGEIVLQAAGEVEDGLGGGVVLDEGRIAGPADLDAAEEVGLRARHLEEAGGLEVRAFAEDGFVGLEADLGAAAVVDGAQLFQLGRGRAAREHHAIELLAAGDFDFADFRQRIHHRDAHAVQAARGRVRLAVELAAGVERAHDDFERALLRILRVRVDGDTAAVVGDGQEAVGVEADFNEGRVAGDGLVHGVVDDFGEEMVQRLLVRAADVHAGTAAHGFKAFEDLDVGGRVVVGGVPRFAAGGFVVHGGIQVGEEIAL